METENTCTISDLERPAPRKITCLRRKIIAVLVLFGFVVAAALIYGSNAYSEEFEMDEILLSPNFTGIVTSRWYVPYTAGRSGSRYQGITTYHLRIYGRYVDGDERITIDQNFRVPAEIYHRHQVGDTFSSIPPPD